MEQETTQVNPGSNASDFQPPTSNPQQNVGNSVQPTTATVQPVQSGNGTSAEQLYQQAERQPNLTVQTDGYSANTLVSVQPGVPRSNSGLLSVTGAIVVLLLIVIIVRRYWQPTLADVPAEDSVAPVETSIVAPEATAVAEATPEPKPKTTTKKAASKKKTGAKKKKRNAKKK